MKTWSNLSLNSHFLSNLGLAMRARKLVTGSLVLERMKDLCLIILATDMSPGSKERFYKKASYYQIPVIEAFTSNELSGAIGLNHRKCIGLLDPHMKPLFITEGGHNESKTKKK